MKKKNIFNVHEHDWPKIASSPSSKKEQDDNLVFQEVQMQMFPPDQVSKLMKMIENMISLKVQQMEQKMKNFQN